MATRNIDTLTATFRFILDKRGAREIDMYQNKLVHATGRLRTAAGAAVAGLGRMAPALGVVAAAAGRVGMRAGDQFTNMQTLLGMTAEQVAVVQERLIALSRETTRPLAEVAAGYYNLRSAGLDAASGMDAITASAKASTAGLGDIASLGKAIGAIRLTLTAEGRDAEGIADVLMKTVELGSMVGEEVAPAFAPLLSLAEQLKIGESELGGAIATYTSTGLSASEASTAVRALLQAFLAPSERSRKILEEKGFGLTGLRELVEDRGFLGAVAEFVDKMDGDMSALRRIIGSVEGVGLALDIGERAATYQGNLAQIRSANGKTLEAFEIAADSAETQIDRVTNNIRLALGNLYRSSGWLIKIFADLPPAIHVVVGGLVALNLASLLFGGVGLAAAIKGLKAMTVALWAALPAMLPLLPWAVLAAALLYGVYEAWRQWPQIVEFISPITDAVAALADWLGRGLALLGSFGAGAARLLFGGDDAPGGTAPAAPPIVGTAPPGPGRVDNRRQAVNIDRLEVSTQATDAAGIAAALPDAVRQQLHDAAENWDSAEAG